MADRPLVVGLCIEDVCSCEIMVSQIASGQVFGPNQRLHLVVQGTTDQLVDDLCDDLLDCAYPLIQGISTCVSFRESGLAPDVVVVILSGGRRCEQQQQQLRETLEGQLGSLVEYIHGLSRRCVVPGQVNKAKVIVTGDMASIAANLLWNKMGATKMAASHFIAVDGYMDTPAGSQQQPPPRGLGQVQRICSWTRQWWTGCKEVSGINLGSKFLDVRKLKEGNSTGYFFSAPVEIDGPQKFHVGPQWIVRDGYIADTRAQSDAALTAMYRLEDRRLDKSHSPYVANL